MRLPKLKRLKPLKVFILFVAIVAYGYIMFRLKQFEHWDVIGQISVSETQICFLFILFGLWWTNISIEAKKWQRLMKPFYRLTFLNALKQVLAGNLTALGTPARLAEPGGRMALLPNEHREAGMMMSFLGGFLQTIILFSGGFIALLFKGHLLLNALTISSTVIGIYLAVMLTIPIGVAWFVYYKRHSTLSVKIRFYLRNIRLLAFNEFFIILLLSIGRVVLFSIQLYFWLRFFSINIPMGKFVVVSNLYFFLIAAIPSFVLTDLGVRASLSLLLLSAYSTSEPLILSAIFCLWFSNQLIPAFWGGFILFRHKKRI